MCFSTRLVPVLRLDMHLVAFLVQEAHDAEPCPPRTFNPSLWKMFRIQGNVSWACLLTKPTSPIRTLW